MNPHLIKLIALVNRLELTHFKDRKPRDEHYNISWQYNYGNDYWVIEHDGFLWSIEEVLPISQNNFEGVNQAATALFKILKTRFETRMTFEMLKLKDEFEKEGWSKEELEQLNEEYMKLLESM